MSVRAYLFKKNEVDSEDENYRKYEIYEEKEPFCNMWKTTHLLQLFQWYGYDGLNDDCNGTMELTDEQFENFMEEFEENTKKWSDYDLEILKKIKAYFDDGNWLLQLNLY